MTFAYGIYLKNALAFWAMMVSRTKSKDKKALRRGST
jgi:hypothetical protein